MTYIKDLIKVRSFIKFYSKESICRIYNETYFGVFWAIIKQVVYVLMFWFFEVVGLRNGDSIHGYDHLLFLFAGSFPWFFISEGLGNASRVITKNGNIMQNFDIPLIALPICEVLPRFLIHLATMLMLFVFFAIRGGQDYYPDVYYLNFVFYWSMLFLFVTAFNYVLSALAFIIRDIHNFVMSVMQAIFWLTPIIWYASPSVEKYEMLFNPIYYFVHGYRITLLDNKFFWADGWYNLYMFAIIIIIYLFGVYLYQRLDKVIHDLI